MSSQTKTDTEMKQLIIESFLSGKSIGLIAFRYGYSFKEVETIICDYMSAKEVSQ